VSRGDATPRTFLIVKSLTLTILALSLCLCGVAPSRVRAQDKAADAEEFEYGRLEELKEKHTFMLLVSRSLSVDARAPSQVSAADVRASLEDPRARPAPGAYTVIGRRLNKYIRKYKSLTSVETRDDPEVFIVFKIMRERPSFIAARPFSYGKMFIIIRGDGEKVKPRIVWQSEGEMARAEDAADAFIKALKAVRGEK
jgi:hypothetical protein